MDITDENFWSQNTEKRRTAFETNGYPRNFINKTTNNVEQNKMRLKERNNNKNETTKHPLQIRERTNIQQDVIDYKHEGWFPNHKQRKIVDNIP